MARLTIEEINAQLLEDVASKDGAIEPLEIRDVVTRRTKDAAHKVWGALDEGNINDRASSEVFVTEVNRADLHVGSFPFVDESDVIGELPLASESISPDNRRHGSFHDNQEPNGVLVDELTMESDLLAAVRAMRPPSENILPPTFVQAGATGFDYGFAGSGPRTTYSYEYQRPLVTIISVSPNLGPDSGGSAITIKGTNFAVGATVTFGLLSATSIVVVDSTTITCLNPTPASPNGRVTVTVRNTNGMQATSTFTYLENDMMNGFRLTLTAGTPVEDVVGATSIYLTPCQHGRIALYNGTSWDILTSNEVSIALGTLTSGKNYDVFAYNNAGVVTLEFSAAWSADTTRTDALTRVNGVYVKSADNTRRYLGTFRTTSTTTTDNSSSKRFLWNYYNQVRRHLSVVDNTNTWTYVNPNSTWRQVRATATNCFEYVSGDVASLSVRATGLAFVGTAAVGNEVAVGIGLDSTTVNSAQLYGGNPNTTTLFMTLIAEYRGYPDATVNTGYHKINWLETGVGAAVTYTFAGDNNTTVAQTGMVGEIMA